MEAVIPTEIGLPTIRTTTPESENEGSVIRELDTSDELQEAAVIRVTSYQRRLANFYNKRERHRVFQPGDPSPAKSFRKYCRPYGTEIPAQLGGTICSHAARGIRVLCY